MWIEHVEDWRFVQYRINSISDPFTTTAHASNVIDSVIFLVHWFSMVLAHCLPKFKSLMQIFPRYHESVRLNYWNPVSINKTTLYCLCWLTETPFTISPYTLIKLWKILTYLQLGCRQAFHKILARLTVRYVGYHIFIKST